MLQTDVADASWRLDAAGVGVGLVSWVVFARVAGIGVSWTYNRLAPAT